MYSVGKLFGHLCGTQWKWFPHGLCMVSFTSRFESNMYLSDQKCSPSSTSNQINKVNWRCQLLAASTLQFHISSYACLCTKCEQVTLRSCCGACYTLLLLVAGVDKESCTCVICGTPVSLHLQVTGSAWKLLWQLGLCTALFMWIQSVW